jgi:outer membrane lipoprotein-sorting protein
VQTVTPDGATGRLLRVCLVVALLTTPLAGCATLTDELESDPPLPDRETAAEKRDALETLSATMTTVEETNETTRRTVREVRQRFDPVGYRERVVAVETDDPNTVTYVSEGQIYAVNESVTARYDPTSDSLTYTGAPLRFPQTSYLDLLAAARANESLDRTDVPALPRAPAPAPTGDRAASFYGAAVDVRYDGTGTVDGREAYRLAVVPRGADTQLRSLTVWLDTETLFPLKQRFESVFRGERETFTRTYENVTVNPTLDAATFRLDPATLPGNPDASGLRYHESHDTLVGEVSVRLPERTLPEGYDYDRGFHATGEVAVVVAHYTAEDAPPVRLTVVTGQAPVEDGERVSLGSTTGVVRTRQDSTLVTWQTENATYTLSGDLDRETLFRLARTAAESTGG